MPPLIHVRMVAMLPPMETSALEGMLSLQHRRKPARMTRSRRRAVEHFFRATNKERDALQLTCQLPMSSRLVADPTRRPLASELTGQIEPSVRKVVSLLLRLGH